MSGRRFLLFSLILAALSARSDELAVGWIGRSPELPYVWGSASPWAEGWPEPGQQVTWKANVRAWTAAPVTVGYRWTIDGFEAARGTVQVRDGLTTVDLPRRWSFTRHRIGFEIDTANVVAEESEANNTLEVFSDGLSVGFWVEQSFYDFFRANQAKLGTGSTSFEDWAQRTIAHWNDMSALAIYPETPRGVLDRWRLDKIVIVPDGSLPLHGLPDEATPGAGPATHPDKDDRTVDLMWGFPADDLRKYRDTDTANPSNNFYVGYEPLHEMGHARYLTDVYAWDVRFLAPAFRIDIRENDAPITGTYISDRLIVHRTPEQGIMNAQYTFIDRYSAIALNFLTGQRATHGNYNEPRNFASFINDLPAQNRLTIRDASGAPVPDADVWFYYSVADGPSWYATNYDDVPDLKLRTDANGQVLAGRSPFAANGKIVQTYGMTNGVAIVRVAKPGYVAYGFLESRLFNLAYWRGETDFADHDLMVGRECDALGPVLLGPLWNAQTGTAATFKWRALAGATAYRLYGSSNLGAPELLATTTGTEATVPVSGRMHWWVEADVALCGTRRSNTGLVSAPAAPPRRRAIRH